MIKLNKILVPVDFSDHSRKAIDYGAALAHKFGSRMVFAHIVPSLAALNYVFPADTYEMEKKTFADAKKRVPEMLPQDYLADLDTEMIVKRAMSGRNFWESSIGKISAWSLWEPTAAGLSATCCWVPPPKASCGEFRFRF